jgi:hypothetical protein
MKTQFLKYFVLATLLIALCRCDNDCTTMTCHNNEECSGSSCSLCTADASGNLGACTRGYSLGHYCSKDSDCDATSNATVCINGKCTVDPIPCGSPCQNNFQCDSLRCSRCVNGITSPAGNCADSCVVDTDCSDLYSCKWCLTNSKTGKKACMVQLNSPCTDTSQCLLGPAVPTLQIVRTKFVKNNDRGDNLGGNK